MMLELFERYKENWCGIRKWIDGVLHFTFGDIPGKILGNDAKGIHPSNIPYYFFSLRHLLIGLHGFLDTQLALTVGN